MVAVAALVVAGCSREPDYDLLIHGGVLVDGAGSPARAADLAVRDGRIAAIGDLVNVTARSRIDASGLVVAPGFIDPHSHAGPALATRELSHAEPLLAQGITTVLVNPDGGGAVDLAAQRRELEADGLGVNVGLLVPHGSVREEVLGSEDRAATGEELQAMTALVQAGLAEGAFGLSSGLYYAPGSYAPSEELIALSRPVAEVGGVYTSHIRDESDYTIGVVAAVDEVLRIARESGATSVVTHIKVLGPAVWGLATEIADRIEAARAEGVAVFADQYPYTASGTSILGALIPRWAQEGGRDALLERLAAPTERRRIREAVADSIARRGGPDRLQFQRHEPDPTIEGRTLDELSAELGLDPAELALELLEAGPTGLVSFSMDEADVAAFMTRPWTMTASDGSLVPMGEGVPHPRSYGTFPRKIRRYVRELELLTLEQAIRSMTSLPASVFGLEDRGVLRVGAFADVVVFDLDELRDVATFSDPHRLAEGVEAVLLAGKVARRRGERPDGLHGAVLRREASSPRPIPLGE